MILDTTNGHDTKVVDAFNELAKQFDDYGLLEIILSKWADDGDLISITEYIKDIYI